MKAGNFTQWLNLKGGEISMARDLSLTGVERFFEDDEIIVSKTDLKGRMTYVNETAGAIIHH